MGKQPKRSVSRNNCLGDPLAQFRGFGEFLDGKGVGKNLGKKFLIFFSGFQRDENRFSLRVAVDPDKRFSSRGNRRLRPVFHDVRIVDQNVEIWMSEQIADPLEFLSNRKGVPDFRRTARGQKDSVLVRHGNRGPFRQRIDDRDRIIRKQLGQFVTEGTERSRLDFPNVSIAVDVRDETADGKLMAGFVRTNGLLDPVMKAFFVLRADAFRDEIVPQGFLAVCQRSSPLVFNCITGREFLAGVFPFPLRKAKGGKTDGSRRLGGHKTLSG